MKLNADVSNGRIIPSKTNYDPLTNNGVYYHKNWLSRKAGSILGSGVVKVIIDDKPFYLNRASCFKIIHSKDTLNKSSAEFKNFKKLPPAQIISQVQIALNQIKNSPQFSGKAYLHLEKLLGEGEINKAAIYTPIDKESFNNPKTYSASVVKGVWEDTPFIALKIVPAVPKEYFDKFEADRVNKLIKTHKEKLQMKERVLKEISKESQLIILRQQDKNTLWANLGDTSTGTVTFFKGRSYAYDMDHPPKEFEKMQEFFHSLLAGAIGEDAQGVKWKLA